MFVSMTPIVFYLFSSVLVLQHFVVEGSNGFSIKLIHRDSIDSPLYPGNLSFEERLERLHRQSKAHINQMASAIKGTNGIETMHPNFVRAPVTVDETSCYLAQVGIGTPNRPYYFMVDTGGAMTWTQCDGCSNCFPQNKPLYPWRRSRTYEPINCNNYPYCAPGHCHQGKCSYHLEYADGSKTTGVLATETFTFSNNQRIPNLIFGCGTNQTGFHYNEPTDITGILGLGLANHTLISQLFDRTGARRFSYCLQPWSSNRTTHTYLRFGTDARDLTEEGTFRTQLFLSGSGRVYHLMLMGISIAGRRIQLPHGSFVIGRNGMPGCVIDTGSPLTHIRSREYNVIRDAFKSYFRRYNLTTSRVGSLDLCYNHNPAFNNYPNMVYHFHPNASLEVAPNVLFLMGPTYFCLSILPINVPGLSALIGSRHQTNHKFLYNIHYSQLSFARKECNERA